MKTQDGCVEMVRSASEDLESAFPSEAPNTGVQRWDHLREKTCIFAVSSDRKRFSGMNRAARSTRDGCLSDDELENEFKRCMGALKERRSHLPHPKSSEVFTPEATRKEEC